MAEKQGRYRSLAEVLRAGLCGDVSRESDRAVNGMMDSDRVSQGIEALSLLSVCRRLVRVSTSKSGNRYEASMFVFAQLPRGPPGGPQRPV